MTSLVSGVFAERRYYTRLLTFSHAKNYILTQLLKYQSNYFNIIISRSKTPRAKAPPVNRRNHNIQELYQYR